MASFWEGFQGGFDWGYNTAGKYKARKGLSALQDEEVHADYDSGELAESMAMTPGGTQAGMLENQIEDFGEDAEYARGLTTEAALSNPNMPQSQRMMAEQAGAALTPDSYQYAGETFDRAPNAFDKRYARQQRTADVYDRSGMHDRAQQARQAATQAEAEGLRFDMDQERLGLAKSADARSALKSQQDTAAFNRTQDINRRSDAINKKFSAAIAGKMKGLDYEDLVADAAPLFNDPSLIDLPGELHQIDGKWMHIRPDGTAAPAGDYVKSLKGKDRADMLGIMQQYALYGVDGDVNRFKAIQGSLAAMREDEAKLAAAKAKGSQDQMTRYTNLASVHRNALKDARDKMELLAPDSAERAGLADQIKWHSGRLEEVTTSMGQQLDKKFKGKPTIYTNSDGQTMLRNPYGKDARVYYDGIGDPSEVSSYTTVDPAIKAKTKQKKVEVDKAKEELEMWLRTQQRGSGLGSTFTNRQNQRLREEQPRGYYEHGTPLR